jgi:hypothetical protein
MYSVGYSFPLCAPLNFASQRDSGFGTQYSAHFIIRCLLTEVAFLGLEQTSQENFGLNIPSIA